MRQFHHDFVFAHIDGEIFAEIEAGFDVEGAVQFDPLRAAGPSVHEFVFDFRLARENGEFGDGAGLLEIDAVVNRDARLQLREFDKGVARFAAEAFEFRAAGAGVAQRARFRCARKQTRR